MTQPKPGTEVIVRKTGEIKTVNEAPMVTLSEVSIANIAHNVQMAEKLVTTLLEKEIDYGVTPGTPTDGLWDAGAAKIMAGFNCYVDHQVLFHTDEEKLISWCIQANIVSRDTQTIVGTGVGAASTKEAKYKYRWVVDPQNFGYGDDEIAKMKKRDNGNKYRIENPEYGELVNTLFQMAAKRAEVDGARSMPGVGGALKKLFEKKIHSQSQSHGQQPGKSQTTEKKENPWSQFWGQVAQLGLTQEQAREKLGVKSIKEWTDAGGTRESAITELAAALAREKTAPARAAAEQRVIPGRKEEEFSKGTIDLLRICSEDFKMLPADVFEILHYPNQKAYEDVGVNLPYDSYLKIKHLQEQNETQEEEQPGEEQPEDFPF